MATAEWFKDEGHCLFQCSLLVSHSQTAVFFCWCASTGDHSSEVNRVGILGSSSVKVQAGIQDYAVTPLSASSSHPGSQGHRVTGSH